MPRITPVQVALGVGAAGAMVDVTSSIHNTSWVDYTYGRQDQFRDTSPAQFTFVLDNYDGRYTPDNAASPLATKVVEGMVASVNIGGRLTSGKIRTITLGSTEADWGTITITCDDMLGSASRKTIGALADAAVMGCTPYLYWPMTDAASSASAAETITGLPGLAMTQLNSFGQPTVGQTFGTPGVPAVGATQVQLTATTTGIGGTWGTASGGFPTLPYQAGLLGFWGFWHTTVSAESGLEFFVTYAGGVIPALRFYVDTYVNDGYSVIAPGGLTPASSGSYPAGSTHYVSFMTAYNFAGGTTTFTTTLFVDGLAQGASTGTAAVGPLTPAQTTIQSVFFIVGDLLTGTFTDNISHLSHTALQVPEQYAGIATEANRLTAITATMPDVTIDALPTDLSTSLLAGSTASTGSGLDAFNDVIRTEQGAIYTATTGSLLAPIQKVQVRARTRPPSTTVAASFDAFLELSGVPTALRDITNLVSSATATSPSATVTTLDAAAVARVGSASSQDTVLNQSAVDLLGWTQDRLNRGDTTGLRFATVTIDALTTPTDRSADLLGLHEGDRVRITNLPSTVLGFTTWDGWLLGAHESHGLNQHSFDLYLAPVLPDTAIYDTDYYMAAGAITLSSGITSSTTTVSFATTGPLLEQATFPYILLVDSEQMRVTACTGATPQVATVVRGVNGTTAVSHTTAATVEVSPTSLYAF